MQTGSNIFPQGTFSIFLQVKGIKCKIHDFFSKQKSSTFKNLLNLLHLATNFCILNDVCL